METRVIVGCFAVAVVDEDGVRISALHRGIPTGMVCPPISLKYTILDLIHYHNGKIFPAAKHFFSEACWAGKPVYGVLGPLHIGFGKS